MASFTPQEIEEFLQQFFDTVGARQYIGARYVPIFGRKGEDTVEWDDLAPYEPLTVVMHLGVSYVSRQYVPTGTPITDTDFWVETYRFNAQVEQYRQEVLGFQGQIDGIRSDYAPLPVPDTYPKYGTEGQVLTTLGNGETMWDDPVHVTPEVAEPLIEDWLDEHPEATTTVQDNSLEEVKLATSLKTALTFDRYAFTGTDVNDIAENSFYYVQQGTTNLPYNDNAYFVHTILYNASAQALMQLAYNFASGRMYQRRYSANTWSGWRYVNEIDTSAFMSNRYAFSGTDVNDIDTNSIYYVSAGTTNLPYNDNDYFVETFLYDAQAQALMQLAYNFASGRMYQRRYSANTWSGWRYVNEIDTSAFMVNRYAFAGTDVNDINTNSIYFCAEGKANLPTQTGGYFMQTILYNTSGTAAMQAAYKFDDGSIYYRRKVSGTWQGWINQSRSSSPSRKRYYAFGDSLMYGAVWVPTETDPYYQIVRAENVNRIPTRIASATGLMSFNNLAVGGAYFVGTGTNTIYNQIANATMNDVGLITVGGGRNDSENTLGDHTATANDGTICGAIKAIIEYLLTNFPKAQIVWVGVTPNTSNNSTVFTRVFAGGWSLNTFDEKVGELCADYHIPYVGWKECSYMNHWADFSGAGGVYSHPNNEESYMQMGNYMAGRVSQYYMG